MKLLWSVAMFMFAIAVLAWSTSVMRMIAGILQCAIAIR